MLALTIQSHEPALPASEIEASVRRALEEAGSVPGAFAASPCGFRRLGAEVAGLVPSAGRWILVTCQAAGDEGHRTHLRERCLTAAQRFMLSLSCDGVDNAWTAEAPSPEALRDAGVALGGAVPVGLIRYG